MKSNGRAWRWQAWSAVAMVAAVWLAVGCSGVEYADEHEVRLEFSEGKVSFDTVFTTLGSATRVLTVYNRTSSDVELQSVSLVHGRASRFRLNVDGDTSLVARHVELLSGDSLLIFVQACIDPNEAGGAFVRTDSIVFSNGQCVPLEAWGRDAVYHRLRVGDTTWYTVLDCEAFRHDRPHVFLSPAAVLDGHTLTLRAGDELYFADGAMLVVDSNARLMVLGSADRPVLFSSLRREEWYRALPGQWQTVWFYNGSVGNVVEHAVIENGTGGLRCYPGSELRVRHTVVRHMSDAGIIGQYATIEGRNLLIYDCYSSLALLAGGDYRFSHCTMADYWNYVGRSRDTASVILSNYYPVEGGLVGGDLRRAEFEDCIVWGNWSAGEVAEGRLEGFEFSSSFRHSIVRGGEWSEDPQFVDPKRHNYRLAEGSPAAGLGYEFDN
ncbi:MAG: hypothetical protein IJU19_00750 [Bacteroidales bacterium]|nr:hypothetical protein [Bacteroidales bacterium]